MSIEITGVSKTFRDVTALDNVSVSFEENKIYGLLGRNGAGKSTLLNIIANRIFADSGQVTVDGMPAVENDAAQQKLYLMGEQMLYPENMRIEEAFRWSCEFYPDFDAAYAQELAVLFSLDPQKKVRSLSTGYASIFKIILALSAGTPYLLLDEPVLGLDANHRELFYKVLIERYSTRPCTIILSTHLIEEVSGVIEEIVIIKDGRVIRSESCESLLSKGYTVSGKAGAVDEFIKGREVIGVDTLGGLKTAYLMGTMDPSRIPDELETGRPDLQKIFIRLTNS